MNSVQITKDCHIIPKWYIRNFIENWNIYFASKENWWNIKLSDNKYSFASKNNIYNYSNNNNINGEFETYLSWKETKVANISKKLINHFNKNIWNPYFGLKYDDKLNIIRIIMQLYEKILYYHLQYEFSKDNNWVIREENLGPIFWHMNVLMPHFYCLFLILLSNDFYRSIIYSKNNKFYLWDTAFHIDSWWKYKQRESFFNHHGSSIYFPLSKNYAIHIEYKKNNKTYLPFYDINIPNNKNKFYKELTERIAINSNEYIAWPNKNYLEFIIKNKCNIWKYKPDIYNEQENSSLHKEAKYLNFSIEEFKNINYWWTKLHLMYIKHEEFERYKAIDKNFYKPCKIEKHLKILTWFNEKQIKMILKERKYVEFFRNSKRNIDSIHENFKV